MRRTPSEPATARRHCLPIGNANQKVQSESAAKNKILLALTSGTLVLRGTRRSQAGSSYDNLALTSGTLVLRRVYLVSN
jgi:hypothetical protein